MSSSIKYRMPHKAMPILFIGLLAAVPLATFGALPDDEIIIHVAHKPSAIMVASIEEKR